MICPKVLHLFANCSIQFELECYKTYLLIALFSGAYRKITYVTKYVHCTMYILAKIA